MTEPRGGARVRSLDGLRGLAASVVVIGHLINASVVPLSFVFAGRLAHLSKAEWLISYTPLHIFFAGQNWVIVFFVLSGFVLSLGAASGARFVATRYYPTRFVRLYVPVWAALVVAAIAHEVVAHDPVAGATPWLNSHAIPLAMHLVAHDATLIFGAGDGGFSTVLWSLRWEVVFSLLLPVFLFVGAKFDRRLTAAASLAIMFLFAYQHPYARYLPPFMFGVVLAYSRSAVISWLTGKVLVITLLSAGALTANWWLTGFAANHAGPMLVAAGATGLVAAGITPGAFARLLDTRILQLLGRRSFSLYLVHEPLLVAAAFALGGRPSVLVLAAVALPIVAVVTEVFYRLVERPGHGWARRAGDWATTSLQRHGVPDLVD
jgi:peptidoglycan/LPS O-acetylase OafA/YrhL